MTKKYPAESSFNTNVIDYNVYMEALRINILMCMCVLLMFSVNSLIIINYQYYYKYSTITAVTRSY